jgi:hypothetical protein
LVSKNEKIKCLSIGTTSEPVYDPNKQTTGLTKTPEHEYDFRILNRSEFNFRKRCKNRETGNESIGNGFSSTNKKEYRFYNGTRCLKDYCIVSTFGYDKYNQAIPGYTGDKWTLTLKSY